jgi:crossover junction endodeoxyribonuclease RusA
LRPTEAAEQAAIKFTIPAIPPSNNKYIGRDAKWEYQNFKKLWCGYVAVYCRDKPEKPFEKSVVRIQYYFRDKRRRDPDNYSGKFLLDGLVAAGIIQDDSFDNITLEIRGGYDRKKPRTEIEITRTEED